MPVVLKIDTRRRLVYSAFYGKVTDEEMLGHRAVMARDPDFNRDFSEIVDLSAVSEPVVSDSALAALAGSPSLFSESSRHIIVAPDDLAFQLSNKCKSVEARRNLFLVRTRAEAYKLLDAKSGKS